MKSNTHATTTRTVAATLALFALSTFAATPAFAKACKKVDIQAQNKSGKEVKVIDLDYYDKESGKWRSEPVKNNTIKNGRYWQIERNLERVNGQDVRVRVQYRVRIKNSGLKQWGKVKNAHSAWSECKKGGFYGVTLK